MKQGENRGDIVIYKAEDGQTALEVTPDDQTVWLSLNQMTALFLRDKSVISRHLRNVYKERELARDSTVAEFAAVQTEREVERQGYPMINPNQNEGAKPGRSFRV